MFKRIIAVSLYSLFLLALMELSARAYYAYDRKMNFFAPAKDLVYGWYPELKNIENYRNGGLNVLILGGSVLTEDWGDFPEKFKSGIKETFGEDVNIVNLAASAHGSLDSLYKYGWVRDKKFDAVLFYHGINEVRANNVPPELWREDYSHYSWYDEVNFFFRYPQLVKTGMMLPYLIKHLSSQLEREALHRDMYVPTHSPREEWLVYGSDIKTKGPFKENVLKIMDIAEEKGEELVIMTFAYCEPTDEDLIPGSPFMRSLEVWGERANVYKGMKEHNDAVREAAGSGEVIFVDQAASLDKREYFTDVCHLSSEGSKVFVNNIIDELNLSGRPGTQKETT